MKTVKMYISENQAVQAEIIDFIPEAGQFINHQEIISVNEFDPDASTWAVRAANDYRFYQVETETTTVYVAVPVELVTDIHDFIEGLMDMNPYGPFNDEDDAPLFYDLETAERDLKEMIRRDYKMPRMSAGQYMAAWNREMERRGYTH